MTTPPKTKRNIIGSIETDRTTYSNKQEDFTGMKQMDKTIADKKSTDTMADGNRDVYPIRNQIQITDMYSLFRPHYDNHFQFSGESHNFWECLYVLEGTVCVSADERIYQLEPGEIIFHKPLEFHKFTVNSPQGVDLLIFSFSAEGALTYTLRNKVFRLSDSQKQLITSLLSYIQDHSAPTTRTGVDFLRFVEPFEQQANYSQMVATYLCQLFLTLAEKGTVSSVSATPDALSFSKAIRFLNYNLHRQVSVQEIAKAANISESSLKRLFARYTGISVHKYFLALKIKAATELLQDGESITDVAEKLGFSNQSYFSRAYKRETGQIPSSLK